MQMYSIRDGSGLCVRLCDYGARITDIELPTGSEPLHLACHYPQPQQFLDDEYYLGATIGPIANRIRHGRLVIDGHPYQLPRNHGAHILHSGTGGFDQVHWQLGEHSERHIEFVLEYAERSDGLPGNLKISAEYRVEGSRLSILYQAVTDKPTYLNLTNHVYLNLNGVDADDITNHRFTLYADAFTQVDADNIPVGALTEIENPYSYSTHDRSQPPEIRGRVDHHFLISGHDQGKLHRLIDAHSPGSGISLTVSSSTPGFQFYTGQHRGAPFHPFAGFCVEPQFTPNAINLEGFASPLTTPEQPYHHEIEFDFSWP